MNLHNVYVLRDIILLGGGHITNLRTMQEIACIVQRFSQPFDPPFEFKWNYQGVYCADLCADLKVGMFFGILEEEQVEIGRYPAHALRAASLDNPSPKAGQIERLAKLLNNVSPRTLKLLSFMLHLESEGFSDAGIDDKTNAYMYHLMDHHKDAICVRDRIQTLM